MADLYAPHTFKLCGHGLELKTSLDAKWRAKPFFTACVSPFLLKYNLKASKADPAEGKEEFVSAGLKRVEVDGAEAPLPSPTTPTSAVVPLKAEKVELFFGLPPPSSVRLAVAANGIEFTFTLDGKWLRKPFMEAVVRPFVHMHNKRTHAPVEAAQLLEMRVDGVRLRGKEMAAPKGHATALDVLGYYTSRVELFFSHEAIANAEKTAAQPSFRWKVSMSAHEYNRATHLDWQVQGFNAADGAAMARELQAHALPELKEIYLYQNNLRCEGLSALAAVLNKSKMPKLRQLHLGKNRIGDEGVISLCRQCDLHLMILSLHTNEIGDSGCQALADALAAGTLDIDKLDLHTNQRISEVGRASLKRVRANANFDAPLELDYGTPFIPRQLTAQRYVPGPNGDNP
ncbi:hypothetical protein AB1Y20_007579 [Prymnesium parvum]|uniref:Uncharacterized protein n=1 Tax=Prymnesium parvum TaxID=97485 RepID=A0AB34IVS8_PRYPA